jgi:DNA-binding NarL/FixJ family response regulator
MTRDLNKMTRDPNKIKVSLVAENRLFRDGVRAICVGDDRFQIVAEGSSGPEMVRFCAECKPDVLLLDTPMSGVSPVVAIREVTKVSRRTRVAVLSTDLDNDLIVGLATAGAAACLSKDIDGIELRAQLRAIAAGDSAFTLWLPPMLDVPEKGIAPTVSSLTDREIEVLQLVSRALSNAEIAHQLYVSEATVKRHLTNTYSKLKARSRLDAVNRAMALGVLVEMAENIGRSF